MAVTISESPVMTVGGGPGDEPVATVAFRMSFKTPEWQGEEVWIGDMRVGTLYTFSVPTDTQARKLVGSHWGVAHNFENRREAAVWFTRIYHALADA